MPTMTAEPNPSETQLFFVALAMSAVMHMIILASLFYANTRYDQKITPAMEVVYETVSSPSHADVFSPPKMESIQQKDLVPQPDIFPRGPGPSFDTIQDVTNRQPVRLGFYQKQRVKIPELVGKRQVTVPILESDKITNPKYMDYHERIREKIRDRAYYYADGPGFENGKVYLTFVLSSDGTLKQIRIDNARTKANAFLRSVGLRSIKDSSPFPAFPPGLNYPELSFNVLISFQVGK